MTHVVCDTAAGTAHAAAPAEVAEVAEVAWCSRAQLDERVPGGVFQPVQGYLDSLLGD